MTANSVISIQNASFSYVSQQPILQVREFAVEPGETVFLYGPSGSGKTTLLGLLTLILSWQSGEMRLFNQDPNRLSQSGRDRLRGERIGYIFQLFNLVPYLSVQENILLPCRLAPGRCKGKTWEQLIKDCDELARHLGISHLLDRKSSDLSVGQQQRVAAARAFIGEPGLVIADEPTSALDADSKNAFVDLLIDQAKRTNAAVVFVSHDRDLKTHFNRTVSIHELKGEPQR